MSKVILITGGQRSGKSTYAEHLALSLSAHPVYMATAHVWDDEFRERVRRHQARRGHSWENIEEERRLSSHDVRGRVVLVDCLTLWCTNFFHAASHGENLPDIDFVFKEVMVALKLLSVRMEEFGAAIGEYQELLEFLRVAERIVVKMEMCHAECLCLIWL